MKPELQATSRSTFCVMKLCLLFCAVKALCEQRKRSAYCGIEHCGSCACWVSGDYSNMPHLRSAFAIHVHHLAPHRNATHGQHA